MRVALTYRHEASHHFTAIVSKEYIVGTNEKR